ncbi:MerR family transcriptional regulator [Candidatus Bathyarchaeota archaeon]|nr:MerR family transcriptional regulator [Candidatus Bathyarchaeota archaeon]
MVLHVYISIAASILGACTKTLRRWEEGEQFKPSFRTPENHRRYDLQRVRRFKNERNALFRETKRVEREDEARAMEVAILHAAFPWILSCLKALISQCRTERISRKREKMNWIIMQNFCYFDRPYCRMNKAVSVRRGPDHPTARPQPSLISFESWLLPKARRITIIVIPIKNATDLFHKSDFLGDAFNIVVYKMNNSMKTIKTIPYDRNPKYSTIAGATFKRARSMGRMNDVKTKPMMHIIQMIGRSLLRMYFSAT